MSRRPGPRIACLHVPLFPLAARLRAEPELLGEGLAIVEGQGQAARVVAATRLARQAGVRPGQTLPQARALLPGLIARARDPECERSAQDALLDVADRFTPRIEDCGEGTVYLDVEGLTRHYSQDRARSRPKKRQKKRPKKRSTSKSTADATPPPDPERELGRELLRQLDAVGLPARVGLASSKLAARVAALDRRSDPTEPVVVPAGREARFLAPLPLHRLSPQSEIAETLRLWGIETIGQLAELSSSEVSSRLGELGHQLHKAARGEDPAPLVARPPSPSMREGMSLEWPLTDLEPFLFIARTTLERLCERLAARGLGCLELELSMQLDPDGYHDRSIRLPSPTREVKTLLTLVRLDLEAHPPQSPVLGFHFVAWPDAPKLAQLSLLGPAALSPDRLATTIARLFALLGPGRVGSPRREDAHAPERFRLVEYTPPPPPKVRPECRLGQGLLAVRVLRPPVPLEVHTDGPAGPSDRPSDADSIAEPLLQRPRPVEVHPLIETQAESEAAREAERGVESGTTEPESAADTADVRSSRRTEPLTDASERKTDGRHRTRPRSRRPTIQGRVRVASGPWELEERWWSDDAVERDYWDVELVGGGLYRLYRDRRSDKWYADGIYD